MFNLKSRLYLATAACSFVATGAFASTHTLGEKVYNAETESYATVVGVSDDGTYTLKNETGANAGQVTSSWRDSDLAISFAPDADDAEGVANPMFPTRPPRPGQPGQPGGPGQPGHPGPQPQPPQPQPPRPNPPGPGPGPGPGPQPPRPPQPPFPQPQPQYDCQIESGFNLGRVGVFHVVTRQNIIIGTFFVESQAETYARNDRRCYE